MRQIVIFTFRPGLIGSAFIFQSMKAAQSCDEIFVLAIVSLPHFLSAVSGGVIVGSEHCLDICEPPNNC